LDIKFDDQGLIVQLNGDGGDCAARSGELITGRVFTYSRDLETHGIYFDKVIRLLEPNGDGVLLRYNRTPYNKPYEGDFATSRDQTIPMIIAAGFVDQAAFVSRVFSKICNNWLRFHNGDLCGPEHLCVILRALLFSQPSVIWQLILFPLFCIGDFFNLLNSIIRIIYSHIDHDDVGDDINHVQICLQAIHCHPTPVSLLSRKLYSKLRYRGVQYAFDWYHRPSSGGNPLNELYRPIINKWFQ
jgi:hypothetical protein